MKRLAAILFWLMAIVIPANSQFIERTTDIELRAAYCLGVLRSQVQMVQDDLIMSALAAKTLAERASRLTDYLSAKGYLSGRDPGGITTGIVRGQADFFQCKQDNDESKCEASCPKIENFKDVAANTRIFKCIRECSDTSKSCKKIQSCTKDFLPF